MSPQRTGQQADLWLSPWVIPPAPATIEAGDPVAHSGRSWAPPPPSPPPLMQASLRQQSHARHHRIGRLQTHAGRVAPSGGERSALPLLLLLTNPEATTAPEAAWGIRL
eukprot:scaffold9816_cov141-Isochrysis_galbana.AAC.6